jgi:hypothetical protein
MESLFEPAGRDGALARIGALRPDSKRAWGTMDAAQAMAHCALAMETATGDATLSRPFAARLLGWMFRGPMLGPKPYGRNGRTHPQLVVKEPKEFAREQARLLAVVRKFHDGGPASAARHEHALLGRLTGEEWDRFLRKHLDHHLKQFGV